LLTTWCMRCSRESNPHSVHGPGQTRNQKLFSRSSRQGSLALPTRSVVVSFPFSFGRCCGHFIGSVFPDQTMYFLQQKVAAAWLLTIRQGEQLQGFKKWFRLFRFPEPDCLFQLCSCAFIKSSLRSLVFETDRDPAHLAMHDR
jgi:hypothetical protein